MYEVLSDRKKIVRECMLVCEKDIEKVQHSRLNVLDRPTSANQASIVSHLRYRDEAIALKASDATMDCDGGVLWRVIEELAQSY